MAVVAGCRWTGGGRTAQAAAQVHVLTKRLQSRGVADPGAEIRPLGLLAPQEDEKRTVIAETAWSGQRQVGCSTRSRETHLDSNTGTFFMQVKAGDLFGASDAPRGGVR